MCCILPAALVVDSAWSPQCLGELQTVGQLCLMAEMGTSQLQCDGAGHSSPASLPSGHPFCHCPPPPCSALSWDWERAEAAVAIWTVYLVWANYAKKVIIILCSLD